MLCGYFFIDTVKITFSLLTNNVDKVFLSVDNVYNFVDNRCFRCLWGLGDVDKCLIHFSSFL
jgi:hypothetical protein